MSPNWLEVSLSIAANLITLGIAYGIIKTKVTRLEKDYESLEQDHSDLVQSYSDHKLDIYSQFVTYESFKEFKREVLDRQMQLEVKLDKVLELIGEIRASIKSP